MEREWVIVATRYSENYWLLWGSYTEDSETRSYSGYTGDINKCERYTKEDLENCGYGFKFYEKPQDLYGQERDHVFMKLDELKQGRLVMTSIAR